MSGVAGKSGQRMSGRSVGGRMVVGGRSVAVDRWRAVGGDHHGRWRAVVGGRSLAGGRWRAVVGGR